MRGAAVDIGSNSVHLLVAQLDGHVLQPVRDESFLLGLGDVVDETGVVPARQRALLLATLVRYCDLADAAGAEEVSLLGTEPLRRAANAREVKLEVERETGLPLHLLSEGQEGALTYLGVTGGADLDRPLLIVDIGGGSTEIILASPGGTVMVSGLASGSARLGKGTPRHDPPTEAELDGLRSAATALVAPLRPPGKVAGVFVGGTATNLVRLAPLDRAGLARAFEALRAMSAQAISERFGVNLRRARQLPAGAALAEAILVRLELYTAGVSEASVRGGAIVARATLGPGWAARLDELIES